MILSLIFSRLLSALVTIFMYQIKNLKNNTSFKTKYMQQRFLFTMMLLFITICGTAQQLPLNTCGIVNVYDAAGNRTKRVYFCNNGVDPYPAKAKVDATKATEDDYQAQYVDALYPNPTTGKFFVTFSKALKGAIVYITDANGRTISKFKGNGYKVDFDLSSMAAGVYFIRIDDAGNIITKKVVKQ